MPAMSPTQRLMYQTIADCWPHACPSWHLDETLQEDLFPTNRQTRKAQLWHLRQVLPPGERIVTTYEWGHGTAFGHWRGKGKPPASFRLEKGVDRTCEDVQVSHNT
jgi:hypothetical protein